MYNTILDESQKKLLPLLALFQKNFLLVWGTAIALKLWHRKSIDFDLFCKKSISPLSITRILSQNNFIIEHTLISNSDELTIIIWWVKITFLYYPFPLTPESEIIPWIIKSPSLLELAAMKAYVLWRRSKWKDYVDMFSIIQSWLSIDHISLKSKKIFEWAFEEKLFREQLCYFDDIDYSEEVEYIWEWYSQETIQNFLCKKAVEL